MLQINEYDDDDEYSLRLPTQGWLGWVSTSSWLYSEFVHLHVGVDLTVWLDVEQLLLVTYVKIFHFKFSLTPFHTGQ